MADSDADDDLADRYRGYLQLCNDRAFEQLDTYVAADVSVDGQPVGLATYADRVRSVVEAFPDYRWRIESLVVNRPYLAARLTATGTHKGTPFLEVPASGRSVRLTELAHYAFRSGLIGEVWSVTDRLAVRRQLTPDG